MNRFPEELDLEQRFRDNRINSPTEFLERLKEVYDLVNGNAGKEIFNGVILPELLRMHGSDIGTAGLEALALLADASFMPHTQVDSFLKAWSAEKIGHGKSDINPLERIALGSPEEGVNLTNPNYILPILLYSNDSRFKRPSENWGLVYKSGAATRGHQLMLTRYVSYKPSIEAVIGAKSARITIILYPPCYEGEIDGNKFNAKEANDPLTIAYGLLSDMGYKHSSNKEYGFLYMIRSQGTTTRRVRWYSPNKIEVPAVTVVFAVLPQQNYDEMIKNQFRNVDQFVLNLLPDNLKSYLTEGGFFSKPIVIGRIR